MIVPAHVKCPFCGGIFKTIVVISMSYGEEDSDFRPHFRGLNPMKYFVHECPYCGYIGQSREFKGVRISKEVPPDKDVKYEHRVIGDYDNPFLKLAKSLEMRGANPYDIAVAYHYAAWYYRLMYEKSENDDEKSKFKEKEKAALKETINWFKKALESRDVRSKERPIIIYLIGELYRLIGEFEQALIYFEKAISESRIKWLIELAKRQMDFARKKDCKVKLFK